MSHEITRILNAIHEGDPHAAELLMPLVYRELRQLASQKLAQENPGQTWQPTELVHEVFLGLVGRDDFKDRSHFFSAAAKAMRHLLIDNARRKQADKRGGGWQRQPLDHVAAPGPDEELLALEEALVKLAALDPLKAELVELRYFTGLTNDQAAEILNISPSTADRHWAYTRAWLRAELRGE
jgi:RNA polymerase sigma factor (TIGR02999 family)